MPTFPQYIRLAVLAAVLTGAGILLGMTGWPQPDRIAEFPSALVAAVLVAAFAKRLAAAEDRGAMTPSFVVDFGALLLLGGTAALVVATAGIAAHWFADAESRRPVRKALQHAGAALIATEAAWLAYSALGGATRQFEWPLQAVPIAAAVIAYCVVKSLSAEVVAPLLNKEAIKPSWPAAILHNNTHYVIGASFAAGFVEIVERGVWQLLPVAAVPLYCAYRAYCQNLNQLEHEYRKREVVESLNQGMAVIASDGRIALWDDALERILDCRRDRAVGRPLAAALPALAQTQLPRVVQEVLTNRTARTLTRVGLASVSGARLLEVKILPVAGGVTLLCHDITERTHAEDELKRNEERLSLAAEGANDGLWEWDLRTQAFYVSGRWKELVGLAADAGIARADDWLGRIHPDDVAPFREALDAHLAGTTSYFEQDHRIRHEDGSYRRFLCRGVATRRASRRAGRIAGSLTDTNDQGSAQEQLRSAGFRDPLTGLCNRAVFVERLGRRLAEFKQQKGGDRFAALYLDLDRFKVVNDSLGHLVGDELLTAVSRRLESCLREGDELARLGGDEFAILLNAIADPQQANAVAFRIQKALSDPFAIGGREVFTSASIGIAFASADYTNPDEIMRDADVAMYHAKSRGKARHELFDADMHERARDRLGLENDLRHAINNNDFEVHYQPIVLLASRKCVGFESLIRWTRNGESVSPAIFIPMAEELGLIEPVGTWVLQQACRTFADWQRQFPDAGIDCITVNVSSRQLMQQNFMLIVEQAVQAARLKPCDLRLEITETALMDSPNVAAELLRELRDFGVKIYLDDFGTGYSSLSHLHKLPVDALKIDRSFVRSLVVSDRPAIVESILALARTLNTSVVAEGIESDDQARELERLGCTHAQGYLFSRPLSSRAAEALLAANEPLGPKGLDRSDHYATTDPHAAVSTPKRVAV
jgi:diguanylate cyclase (GGDEF)-like protein/PAS domain S-box-containing protein